MNMHVTFNAGTASEVQALRGLSLHVERGDFIAVIGANGAGKSTLFNVIAGTIPVERGSITLNNRDITHLPEYRRSAHIARVFQNPSLGTCPGLTVLENLALASRRGKRPGLSPGVRSSQRALFRDLLHSLNLDLENRLDMDVALLSGGQRQVVTLLMATLNQPDILLLDEHTAALDPNAAGEVIDLTVKLAMQHHLTVIMITHSMQQACQLGNRVVMMNRGQVMFEVGGEERALLSFDMLIERFKALRTQDELSDRAVLD